MFNRLFRRFALQGKDNLFPYLERSILMNYLTHPQTDVDVSVSYKAEIDPEVAAEKIRDALLKKSCHLQRRTKTNRAMWPDTELLGVETVDDVPLSFEMDYNCDAVRIHTRFSNFDEAHQTVSEWTDGTEVEIPSKDEFFVQSILLTGSREETGVTYDETKCSEDNGYQCFFEHDGINARYSGTSGFCSIHFESSHVNEDDAESLLVEMCSQNRLLVGDISEAEVDEEETQNTTAG